jgi:rare lipoprotein A (peptidoglycan hydrolase)
VAAVICVTLFGAPLLLLQNTTTSAHAPRSEEAVRNLHNSRSVDVHPAGGSHGVNLPSHLVDYHVPATTTTTAPASTTTSAAPATTTSTAPPPPPTTTTTDPPPPAPTTTTTTAPPVPAPAAQANDEDGEATWYSEAPSGMCASPTLPFGTVLTVVNDTTGASTVCTVDDREGAGYPRVVDMSPEGFEQIADLSQGVVDVTISW